MYVIDVVFVVEYCVCCYGFYGMSYQYVSEVVVVFFGCDVVDFWQIVFYFGNGVFVIVIDGG